MLSCLRWILHFYRSFQWFWAERFFRGFKIHNWVPDCSINFQFSKRSRWHRRAMNECVHMFWWDLAWLYLEFLANSTPSDVLEKRIALFTWDFFDRWTASINFTVNIFQNCIVIFWKIELHFLHVAYFYLSVVFTFENYIVFHFSLWPDGVVAKPFFRISSTSIILSSFPRYEAIDKFYAPLYLNILIM